MFDHNLNNILVACLSSLQKLDILERREWICQGGYSNTCRGQGPLSMEAERRTVSQKGNNFWALISFDFTYRELTEFFQVHFY